MKRQIGLVLVVFVVVGVAGCSNSKVEQAEAQMQQPINCNTAEGDIRVLQHEKANVMDQMAAGVSSISPAGAVLGVATGKEGQNLSITTGDYNTKIDQRIAAIKSECNID